MRRIEQARKTKETDISIAFEFPENGSVAPDRVIEIETGVPFFDHMLHAMVFHGGFAASIRARGDVAVDDHHTVEDVGIVLGRILGEYTGQVGAVRRFGHAAVPMDDALAEATIDLGGRPYLVYLAEYPQDRVGTFDASLAREFFQGLANAGLANVHCRVHYGLNTHHMVEALFKAFGRALAEATRPVSSTLSTKGLL